MKFHTQAEFKVLMNNLNLDIVRTKITKQKIIKYIKLQNGKKWFLITLSIVKISIFYI